MVHQRCMHACTMAPAQTTQYTCCCSTIQFRGQKFALGKCKWQTVNFELVRYKRLFAFEGDLSRARGGGYLWAWVWDGGVCSSLNDSSSGTYHVHSQGLRPTPSASAARARLLLNDCDLLVFPPLPILTHSSPAAMPAAHARPASRPQTSLSALDASDQPPSESCPPKP